MKEKIISLVKKYGITALVSAALTLLIIYLRNYSEATLQHEKYRILADAFTIPGVVLIMFGVLIWVSTTGFFDMLSYGLSRFVKALIPFSEKKDEAFFSYVQKKKEKRFSGYSFLFITGAVFLVVAIIFTILFYSVY